MQERAGRCTSSLRRNLQPARAAQNKELRIKITMAQDCIKTKERSSIRWTIHKWANALKNSTFWTMKLRRRTDQSKARRALMKIGTINSSKVRKICNQLRELGANFSARSDLSTSMAHCCAPTKAYTRDIKCKSRMRMGPSPSCR